MTDKNPEKNALPNLWVWNGAYTHESRFSLPDFNETSARLKPLLHGRNELYIPAARLRELVEKYDAQGPAGDMDLVHELEALLREDEKD